ncbi:MAG: hypothetical protein ABSC14_10290 [Desulfomonilia bacterium]
MKRGKKKTFVIVDGPGSVACSILLGSTAIDIELFAQISEQMPQPSTYSGQPMVFHPEV